MHTGRLVPRPVCSRRRRFAARLAHLLGPGGAAGAGSDGGVAATAV
jgi:hypothetical protein